MPTGRHFAAADADPPESPDDWDSFRRLVLYQQAECARETRELAKEVAALKVALAVQQVKLSLFAGAAGAFSSVAVTIVVELFFRVALRR